MKQLTMNDIYNLCNMLQSRGYDLSKLRVYLGNDDELNGIHNGWYCELVENKGEEEDNLIVDLINENIGNNIEKNEKFILIS
ncbi:MAG: hypothetical protein ACI4OP_01625 [Candidatus Coprovivens sp.]